MKIHDRSSLIHFIENGSKFDYLFFWGHRQKKDGTVTKSCFSQWYPAPFFIDKILYPTAEHYMMAQKARLFNDYEIESNILKASSPLEAKELGRSVNGFHLETWNKNAFATVVEGNKAKFAQNLPLRDFLLTTGDAILVEASPTDLTWGIGLAEGDPEAANPKKWKGKNWLGFALMLVRDTLKALPQ